MLTSKSVTAVFLGFALVVTTAYGINVAVANSSDFVDPTSIGNLSCYECSESYSKTNPWTANTSCQTLIGLNGRPCMASQVFCTVQISIQYDVLISISRSCTDNSCVEGCIYDGYPMTQINCVNCCNTSYCNSMTTGSKTSASLAVLLSLLLSAVLVTAVQLL